ncbi:MAG: hypothetical protein GXO65_04600 [Euryarchaeota archaeon]|nr:hypothetical protein [Euryarchaeota archaeon]
MVGCPYYRFLENCYSPGKDCGHREHFCRGEIIRQLGPEVLDQIDFETGGVPVRLMMER